jgi:hypothetical protein
MPGVPLGTGRCVGSSFFSHENADPNEPVTHASCPVKQSLGFSHD